MKIELDNNQRKFLVQSLGWAQRDIFCNLHHIPQVIADTFSEGDEFVIFEYWNRRLKRIRKKVLNEMFEANQIDYKLK